MAALVVLVPAAASACRIRRWCSPPEGAPTSAVAELESANECDTVARSGSAALMRPSSWLRFSRAAEDFREVNEARDYAVQYRVRAGRVRSVGTRLQKFRVATPAERSGDAPIASWRTPPR
jgi:hypothetical protein